MHEKHLPPSDFVDADPSLIQSAMDALASLMPPVYHGATRSTDAPYSETSGTIESYRSRNILAVEMEAAALYALAQARKKPVLGFDHVTSQKTIVESNFEKGEGDDSHTQLSIISAVACAWRDTTIGRTLLLAKREEQHQSPGKSVSISRLMVSRSVTP